MCDSGCCSHFQRNGFLLRRMLQSPLNITKIKASGLNEGGKKAILAPKATALSHIKNSGGLEVGTGVGTVQAGWLQIGHLREEDKEGRGRGAKTQFFLKHRATLSSIGPSVLSSLAW